MTECIVGLVIEEDEAILTEACVFIVICSLISGLEYRRITLKTFSAVTRTERYRCIFTTHSNAERPDDLDDWKERIHKIIMDQVR